MSTALHAVRRFGLGADPDAVQRLRSPESWLQDQISERSAGLQEPTDTTVDDYLQVQQRTREARRAGDTEALQQSRRALRGLTQREVLHALHQRVHSSSPFVERLVAFWSNHLCISVAANGNIGPLAGWYERDVIRPHVLGRYEDMVLASAEHPAMLLYLDNAASIGPRSLAAQRAQSRGRNRGLNENYARELLELHTLGVDGPYDQEDVEQLARILTGWTVQGLRGRDQDQEPGFVFRPALHEPGAKTLLGKRYVEAGQREGIDAIRDLCRHAATARFLATKLVRHFVADDPPLDAVRVIENVFHDSGGDLQAVARALVSLDAAWDPQHVKFRSPQDWIVSVLRIAPPPEIPRQVGGAMRSLRHPLWAPAAPKGYGDSLGDWADPDSLMNRAELGRSLAKHLKRQGWKADDLLSLIPVEERDSLRAVLGSDVSTRDQVALLVGGPAFQWR